MYMYKFSVNGLYSDANMFKIFVSTSCPGMDLYIDGVFKK